MDIIGANAVLSFIIIITILGIAHELGHFEVARRFGIKATKIGVGFKIPRMAWLSVSKKIRGVEVSLNPILAGAYVNIDSDEVDKLDSVFKKIAIYAAGPLVNLFSGIALLTLAMIMRGAGLLEAFTGVVANTVMAIISLPQVFSNFSSMKENLAGPIGIMNLMSGESVPSGVAPLMFFFVLLGALSIGFAIMNLIPLVPLDGGRIFLVISERVFGKNMAFRILRIAYVLLSLAAFIALIGFAILNDLGAFN
ncbi:MAG: site-2 protease family protein [Candidatus Paceibacterota bacterium]|jgi:membrane-associated protease RseP (regulator of RpoE activity)